jgi:hypothetical protein
MKKTPPYSDNLHGACTIYAVANLLHFDGPNSQNLIASTKPKKNGHLVSDIEALVNKFPELRNGILYYCDRVELPKDNFFKIYPFWQLSEHIAHFQSEMYACLLFHVVGKSGSLHVVSAYLNLDNFAIIAMDSQGEGNVELFEVATFFEKYTVFGCSMILKETETGYIPYLVDREIIKQLWKN